MQGADLQRRWREVEAARARDVERRRCRCGSCALLCAGVGGPPAVRGGYPSSATVHDMWPEGVLLLPGVLQARNRRHGVRHGDQPCMLEPALLEIDVYLCCISIAYACCGQEFCSIAANMHYMRTRKVSYWKDSAKASGEFFLILIKTLPPHDFGGKLLTRPPPCPITRSSQPRRCTLGRSSATA